MQSQILSFDVGGDLFGGYGERGDRGFLNYLTVGSSVSPATPRIALNALVYLYTKFLKREPLELSFNYAKPTRHLQNQITHVLNRGDLGVISPVDD